MKKIIYILIGLMMVGNMIYGEEKYPPYPDVWGVELNWKDKSSLESRRMTAGGIYKMKDEMTIVIMDIESIVWYSTGLRIL